MLLLIGVLRTQAAPLARHCGDAGPLPLDDPSFCGCTWGEVFLHGRPVSGAVVTLTYEGGVITEATRLTSLEAEPYFDLTAHNLGAQRGDVLTLTVQFAGRTISRAVRAWPEPDGEQHVVLALEERGTWRPLVTGGYTRALALDADVAWAGGPDGVVSVSLSSGVSVAHTLPLDDPTVRAIAVGAEGHIWTAGDGGVAEFDGGSWQTHTVPLTGTPRALTVDGSAGAVWLGGGDVDGGVVVYDGSWQAKGSLGAPVTALAVDEAGRVWAGTWDAGVYRQDGSGGWTNYRAADGLGSDYVLGAAVGEGAVWFGAKPYVGAQVRGGISRYDLTAETWRVYTQAHGLPAVALSAEHEAPDWVYALASGEGTVWAGTEEGVGFLVGDNLWASYTVTHGLRSGPVMAVAAEGGTVAAAASRGLDVLDQDTLVGEIPMAQIEAVSPLTLSAGTTLTLRGGGADNDEGGERVVAWDWSSDRDGPLCTTANCTIPHGLFTPGEHAVRLRVQDDEGAWSVAAVESVTVKEAWNVYLPLVIRG
jgi:hypothetical protein